MIEQGARVQAIIYPPVGLWPEGRLKRRYERLLAFLRDRKELASRCEFVYSVKGGSNLLFLGEELLFEGYKTGIEGGFGWTMVYSEKNYLKTRLTIFDMLFQSARQYTLNEFGQNPSEDDPEALREAVIEAVRRAEDGNIPRSTRPLGD